MACASTVAVVVPSPAVSDVLLATSRTIWAPMFWSGSFRSISLATVTPSLVIVGEPNFLSRTTLRPLGPRVTFTASASLLTPCRIAWRDSSPYTICLAISWSPVARHQSREACSGAVLQGVARPRRAPRPRRDPMPALLLAFFRFGRGALDDAQHFVLAHDEVLLTIELDFLTGILSEQDQ